jgi:fructose transport system permease protein
MIERQIDETPWGVRVYAIGNSPVAARLNGVNVTRVVFSVYALAGVFLRIRCLAGLGPHAHRRSDLLSDGQSGQHHRRCDRRHQPLGGCGGVAGTLIGTLIVVALKNGLTQARIDSLYQQIATGALVMLAVGADEYLGRGHRA